MLVSVCIPAYQAERTLGATITSVLEQTYTDFELVIIDDQSDDGTVEVARSFDDSRLRVVLNDRNTGLVENFNRAVAETSGEFVKLVCADDLLRPDCLAAQLDILRADPGVALTACRRDMVDEHGRLLSANRGIPPSLAGRLDGRAVVQRVIASGYNPIGEPMCVMFRRDAQRRAGEFSPALLGPVDLDLWIRILRYGDFYGDTTTRASFRIHPGSVTSTIAAESGREDRQLIRHVAADPQWEISRGQLWSGLVRSRGNQLHRQLRVARSAARSRATGPGPVQQNH